MKIKTTFLLFSFLLFAYDASVAQNPFPDHTNCEREMMEAARWYFGVYAGMDFTSGEAVAETGQPDVFQTPINSGVMSDSSGNLLFLSNGKQIYNRSFTVMYDGLFVRIVIELKGFESRLSSLPG